ncbi:MAG: hypothetical protein HZY79_07415 [Rhodoblastus sp.]|nr:MAG: hypothetical protein HZY79_07415 [Rhodoblastus sp.]
MPTRRNPSKTAEKRPVDPVKPAVAVVTPPPDANADPNARAPVDLQAVLSGDVEASEPPPPPVPQPRFGADAFAMPAPRVREIAPQKSAKKRAEITPQRFQSRCQASWGKLAGEGPFGVCVLN